MTQRAPKRSWKGSKVSKQLGRVKTKEPTTKANNLHITSPYADSETHQPLSLVLFLLQQPLEIPREPRNSWSTVSKLLGCTQNLGLVFTRPLTSC